MSNNLEFLGPRYFILRYYNPSPGNPVAKNMDFDNDYIYISWTDGNQTKTPIKKIEDKYDNDGLEGTIIWLTDDINIFIDKYDENEISDFDED